MPCFAVEEGEETAEAQTRDSAGKRGDRDVATFRSSLLAPTRPAGAAVDHANVRSAECDGQHGRPAGRVSGGHVREDVDQKDPTGPRAADQRPTRGCLAVSPFVSHTACTGRELP